MAANNPTAPGELEKVRRFVNTRDIEVAADEIATPRTLITWLRQHSLLETSPTADRDQMARAHRLRETLRECMLANHDRTTPPARARAVLNDMALRADICVTFDALGTWRPRPRVKGVDGALGLLLAYVAEAMSNGEWTRLKVCLNDSCRWAFYDHSRARTGRWCSMQICGNRSKQQAWRHRQT